MVDVLAKHEVAAISPVVVILQGQCVLLPRRQGPALVSAVDEVLTRVLVQTSLHQEVEEGADCRVVSEVAVDVSRPEQRVGGATCGIREADQVDCDMANDALFIQDIAYAFTDRHQVHVW